MNPLLASNSRIRKTFAKIGPITEIPNLIDIQKRSYAHFLQADIPPEERAAMGLQEVFQSVFPIKDFNETASLEFVKYSFDEPKYTVEECVAKGMTFSAPLRVVVRLVVWDTDEDAALQSIRDVKEQEVYFGEIPLMTENGTFVINGTERVVVSQLHRSPGAFFDKDKTKSTARGKAVYSARIIPYRGSWLDFEYDHKNLVYVRIDRKRKIHVTVLLKALGYSEEEIINFFYLSETIYPQSGGKYDKNVVIPLLSGQMVHDDIKDPKTGEVLVKKGRKFTKFALKKLEQTDVKRIKTLPEELVNRVIARTITDPKTGAVIAKANELLTETKLAEVVKAGVANFQLLYIDNINTGSDIHDTLLTDKINNQREAILEVYAKLRPGEPPTEEMATSFFENLFFNPERYDLSAVGRLKLNHKFAFSTALDKRTLTRDDIIHVVKYLIDLKYGRGEVDDIDHLGNRRVRAVGELVEAQYRIGLVRMERAIRERMSLQEVDTLMPHELINSKPVTAVINEFFGSSQLSQFMDQINPLSEVTHKRRLSALGPGGLTRERAGFEVRDVHPTHYGRICPIETPEGPNIGLIVSLSTYARVNDFGFIETPYRRVGEGRVTDEVKYYSSLEEDGHVIAQANALTDKKGRLQGESVSARLNGEYIMAKPEEVTLMDVSPNQLVSVAASLIPFLENDDANRALMGSNMQRQAVPLIQTQAPMVGTGIEGKVARDSGVTVVARNDGIVESVDATRIVVRVTGKDRAGLGSEVDIYNLIKYQRSNQTTCINQKPVVAKGERVQRGDVLADGPGTDRGELALGRNVVVAFMPWGGYNYEDSILLNEKLVSEDVFTSVHIEEFETVARDTKLGKEEISRDIPNVGEEALKNLDESGIIRIGAEVKPGDILVGKVTPKGETQLSPEEKLLRAIFGDKAGDVKDTSLRVPPGVTGTVIGARVFNREGVDKDARSREIEEQEISRLLNDQEDEIKIISDNTFNKIAELLIGKTAASRLNDEKGEALVAKGKEITRELLDTIPRDRWMEISVSGGGDVEGQIQTQNDALNEQKELVRMLFRDRIERVRRGDELPPGVIKMIKTYVAIKRKISVGDKMAGRHGNKGVVSRVLPEEDMPYTADGSPVDIVLNPLGVPSRMNVGQILETHLGWAAHGLAKKIQQHIDVNYSADALKKFLLKIYNTEKQMELIEKLKEKELLEFAHDLAKRGVFTSTPVFDGASLADIKDMLRMAEVPENGQVTLFDGRTGDTFTHKVTVGVMYMLKLHHLVDDKIHARSIGPYSLVTQQPLGGKAQFGGQRLGEMEVWAMEAYGAAHTLQEFLTVKSDDIQGRTRMYESIVKGENKMEPGIPESFNVLVKELQALGLEVIMTERNVNDKESGTLPL
jgi:DNA-directed RNA polymerase subunit beta